MFRSICLNSGNLRLEAASSRGRSRDAAAPRQPTRPWRHGCVIALLLLQCHMQFHKYCLNCSSAGRYLQPLNHLWLARLTMRPTQNSKYKKRSCPCFTMTITNYLGHHERCTLHNVYTPVGPHAASRVAFSSTNNAANNCDKIVFGHLYNAMQYVRVFLVLYSASYAVCHCQKTSIQADETIDVSRVARIPLTLHALRLILYKRCLVLEQHF